MDSGAPPLGMGAW